MEKDKRVPVVQAGWGARYAGVVRLWMEVRVCGRGGCHGQRLVSQQRKKRGAGGDACPWACPWMRALIA